jgi:hypothetical protein
MQVLRSVCFFGANLEGMLQAQALTATRDYLRRDFLACVNCERNRNRFLIVNQIPIIFVVETHLMTNMYW